MSSVPFRVFVRRLDDSTFACRFRVNVGKGTLGLRAFGRPDPAPSVQHEEDDLSFEYIRASRFVHIPPSGDRHSYSFARLPEGEEAKGLPEGWTELAPSTRSGFRYLLYVPEDVASMATEPGVDRQDEGEERKNVSYEEGLPEGKTLEDLERLTLEEARVMLKQQAARVVELEAQIAHFEGKLEESGQREDDLLALLGRWRERTGV